MPPAWYNPHPAAGDFELELASGLSIVFREVALNTETLYGESTFRMGANTPQVFEAPVDVRVSSAIQGEDGRRALLFGKYEITKAQYAYVMGEGNPLRGLRRLSEISGDSRLTDRIEEVFDENAVCHLKRDVGLDQLLSEPITYLSYPDYVAFIDMANGLCISHGPCAEKLRGLTENREVAAFLRLPLEHEWEYVARRGGANAQGLISRQQMQTDVPGLEAGQSVREIAHVGGDPDRLIPIGSRAPVDGIYDLLGNAQELMQNAFTSEIGYGAVGGYVARGGHYRTSPRALRVSQRSELLPFRVDEETNEIVRNRFPYSGLRLALSMPVVGSADRIGSTALDEEFQSSFEGVGESVDRGGDRFGEAADAGQIRAAGLEIRDRLDAEDTADFFRVRLVEHAAVRIILTGAPGVEIVVYDPAQRQTGRAKADGDGNASLSLAPQLPGDIIIGLSAPGGTTTIRYSLTVASEAVPDTGLATASQGNLEDKLWRIRIGLGKVQGVAGFVGESDLFDVYPIENATVLDGILVELSDLTAPTTVRILNDRLRLTSEKRLTAENNQLVAPMAPGAKGFLQIEADSDGGTLYRIATQARRSRDVQFATSRARAEGADPLATGGNYEGFLGAGLVELHFRVELRERQRVRIELSGLSADADLALYQGSRLIGGNGHQREGAEPEVLLEELEPGTYTGRITLADRAATTPVRISYTASEPARPSVMSVSEARQAAQRVIVGGSAGSNRAVQGQAAGIHYFRLVVQEPGELTIDLRDFLARADLDLTLERGGAALRTSSLPGSAAESITTAVETGEYMVRVEGKGAEPFSDFRIAFNLRSVPASDLDGFGTFVSSHSDWKVFRQVDGDKITCWAVTEAYGLQPNTVDVFPVIPTFYVGYMPGSNQVIVSLLYVPSDTSPNVQLRVDGRRQDARFEENWLKPLSPDKNTISNTAISAITRGQVATVSGSIDRSFTFDYSLSGYSAANRAANRECGAQANWMVR